ncbi:MAG: LEA type 2 family protein [Halovenus sp.]
MASLKRVAAGIGGLDVGVIVLLTIAYLTGIIGLPSVGVDDPGDWGNTTDNETEIITTLNVDNPNPIGVTISSGFSADYQIAMNDVELVEGSQDSLSIPKGQSTTELRSALDHDKLTPWWVAYVENNETIDMRATGNARVSALVDKRISFPAYEETLLEDQRPVVDSFDGAVSDMEDEYTVDAGPATAGYEIRDASAEWGEVSEPTSNMTLEFEIHNPGDVPVPLVPDGFRLNATGNDVPLFTAGSDALTPRSVDSDAILAPNETETVVYTVEMDNENIDEWFVSHIENDEQTDFVIKPRLEFAVPDTDVSITVPQDSPGYRCSLQTAILVDNQTTETNCGSGGSAEV